MKQRKRNADETSKNIEKIIDYNKNAQKIFLLASKVAKGKSEPKGSISERIILRKAIVAKIKREEKKHKNCFSICTKTYARQKVQKMRMRI